MEKTTEEIRLDLAAELLGQQAAAKGLTVRVWLTGMALATHHLVTAATPQLAAAHAVAQADAALRELVRRPA